MAKRTKPALIGAFVLGAITLAVIAVVAIGSGRFFRNTRSFVLFFSGSVNGLDKGSLVKFRGVPIGAVTDILLGLPQRPREYRIPVVIEIDNDRLVELGASGRLTDDPAIVDRMMKELGLRAQLKQQSFITGLLYISLDFFPGSPLELVLQEEAAYQEIATLPTTLEQAEAGIQKILDRLSNFDFDALGKSINGVLEGVNKLVGSPEAQETIVAAREALNATRDAANELRVQIKPLGKSVSGTTKDVHETLARMQQTLDRLERLTDPQAPLVNGLTATVVELGEAARAVRHLAERIERDPSVLLTGKEAK